MTNPQEAREAARRIVEHEPNKHGWGYSPEVLLIARALLNPWQDISTAPKDGTLVDLMVRGERIADCYWSYTMQGGKRQPDGPFDGWCCDTGEAGLSGFNPYPNRIDGKPTLWMLPASPKQEGLPEGPPSAESASTK